MIKDILKVSTADIISIFVLIIIGFIYPKILTIEDYAIYKTFALLVGITGILHFGVSDAMHLELPRLSNESERIAAAKGYFIIAVLVVAATTILTVVLAIVYQSTLLLLWSIYIPGFHILHFMRLYYRAIGSFTQYGKLQSGSNIARSVAVVGVMSYPTAVAAILGEIFYTWISGLVAVKHILARGKVSYPNFRQLYLGFALMVSNTLLTMFLTTDRYMAKIFYQDYQFAMYAFAVSMLGILIIPANSISFVIYINIIKNKESIIIRSLQLLKTYQLLIIPTYYILSKIIEIYLPKYQNAIPSIKILFAAAPMLIATIIFYIPEYKATQKMKEYTIATTIGILTVILTNLYAVFVYHTILSLAYATLISMFIYFIVNSLIARRHMDKYTLATTMVSTVLLLWLPI